MTRRLRRPPAPRVYSYRAPEAITMSLPIVPQAAPRREGAVGRVVVAVAVGVPAGALAGLGLFVGLLAYMPWVLP